MKFKDTKCFFVTLGEDEFCCVARGYWDQGTFHAKPECCSEPEGDMEVLALDKLVGEDMEPFDSNWLDDDQYDQLFEAFVAELEKE